MSLEQYPDQYRTVGPSTSDHEVAGLLVKRITREVHIAAESDPQTIHNLINTGNSSFNNYLIALKVSEMIELKNIASLKSRLQILN